MKNKGDHTSFYTMVCGMLLLAFFFSLICNLFTFFLSNLALFFSFHDPIRIFFFILQAPHSSVFIGKSKHASKLEIHFYKQNNIKKIHPHPANINSNKSKNYYPINILYIWNYCVIVAYRGQYKKVEMRRSKS